MATANYYDFLTNDGVIVPDTALVLAAIENEMKALLVLI